jgi:mono/diheme cytochrome c family protein
MPHLDKADLALALAQRFHDSVDAVPRQSEDDLDIAGDKTIYQDVGGCSAHLRTSLSAAAPCWNARPQSSFRPLGTSAPASGCFEVAIRTRLARRRTMLRRTLAALAGFCLLVAIGFVMLGWRPELSPIAPPVPGSFDPGVIRQGAELAAAGNCLTCHTTIGGRSFAGGVPVRTPFGTIYSTNITPDPETGIGRWSGVAFRRALREGVSRDGRQLYPAFPYDHFTLATDQDDRALYAYVMTRDPVHAVAPANELPFPLNIRLLIAGWKLLYFREGPYRPDPVQSDAWNRGAYLVEGLAHCGTCHTPHNALGAETKVRFAGGEADGWTAYALDRSSPAPVPWDAQALQFYLRNGWHDQHGIARGPMAPVIDNLAVLPDSDLRAIAGYMAAIAGEPSAERRQAAQALISRVRTERPGEPASEPRTIGQAGNADETGGRIYQATCAVCHDGGRPLPFGGIDLALSTGPSGPDARNLINVVLFGLPPANGARSPIMPGFANALTDQQLAALLDQLRSRFGNQPPWSGIAQQIDDARRSRLGTAYPSHGTDPARAVISQSKLP